MPISANSVMNPAGFKKQTKGDGQKPQGANPAKSVEIAIPITSIRVDGGTQHRPLDEETVQHYADMMADGAEFPPVEVVQESKVYWLWDGFHRLPAFMRASPKKTTIQAMVRQGTKRDAIWLSFAANKAHGLKRPYGSVRAILMDIFNDPEWIQKGPTEIAKHVGCSRVAVSGVKKEWAAEIRSREGGNDEDDADEEKAIPHEDNSTSEKKNRVIDHNKADSGVNIYTKHAGRNCTESALAKTPPKAPPEQVAVSRVKPIHADVPRETFVDEDGVEVPAELRPAFIAREELRAWTNALTAVKKQVHQQAEANPIGWSQFPMQKFDAMLSEWREIFLGSRIALICPKCGGVESKTCRICRGRKVVTEYQLAQRGTVPAEFRNLNRTAKGLPPVDEGNQRIKRK